MKNSLFFSSITPAQQQKYLQFASAYGSAYEKGHGCTDARLLSLPHYRRMALHDGIALEAQFLEEFAPNAVAEAKRPGSTRYDIAQTMVQDYPLLAEAMYLNRFDVLCDIALRLMGYYGRIRSFQTTDALEAMLQETDFGQDIPAEWFRLPFNDVFIEFGEHRRFPVHLNDPNSGEHIIEGVYVMSGNAQSMTDGQLVRGFDLVIFGSPVGKSGVMDDCFIHMGLPIRDESLPIVELVTEVVDHYARQDEFPNSHAFRPVVEHVAKVLVYLGTKEARQHSCTEGREAARRITGLKSPAKREKAARQAARLYDRIVVGPEALPAEFAVPHADGGSVRPHIRRGHFRAQPYGPQHSLRRPVWIQPTLIGKSRLTGELAQPAYVVQ